MGGCEEWDSWRKPSSGRGIFRDRNDAEERDREAPRGAGAAQPTVLPGGCPGDQRLRVRSEAEALAGARGRAYRIRRCELAIATRRRRADDRRFRDRDSRAADALDRECL